MSAINSLAAVLRRKANAVTLDPLTEDYAARLLVEGYTLTGSRLTAYDTFLKAGATNGWLEHIIEMYAFEGTAVDHAKVKLVYAPATPSDLVVDGYVDADVRAEGGMISATAGRKFTTINGNTLSNVAGISMWLRNGYYGSASAVGIGWSNGTFPYFQLSTEQGVSGAQVQQKIYAIWGAEAPDFNTGLTVGHGFYRLARTSLSSMNLRINDQLVGTNGTTITDSRPNKVIEVAMAPLPMDFGAIDDGAMTTGEATAFANDLAALMESLGRVPISDRTNYFLGTGQSLSVGSQGTPGLSIPPVTAYGNSMPFYGKDTITASGITTAYCFGPTFEDVTETILTSMLNTNSALRRASVADSADYDGVGAIWGQGGAAYSTLAQGTTIYNKAIESVTSAKAVHDLAHSGTFQVPAVFVVHGEADISSATYQADIEEWQTDYETDIKAVTGQTGTIPMVHSQPSSWTYNLGPTTALSPYAILAAHVANPTKHSLACPKYFLTHAADGVHLTNTSYRLLGGYYGKALNSVMATGSFTPLRPTAVSRSGAVITLSFAGRVGSLVLDTTAVSDPGNYGFEWAQTGGTAATISAVALINSNTQVQITLSTDPGSPSAERVRYAYTGISDNDGGPTTGPRGCLRDSDTTENYNGDPLPNWCVHFDYAVGYAEP